LGVERKEKELSEWLMVMERSEAVEA